MITVTFNTTNLYTQMGIVLEHFDIGLPEMKVSKVSVPGRHGELDMSKALTGYTHFGNRTLTLTLGLRGSEAEREQQRIRLVQLVMNQSIKVSFSHLTGYFLGTVHFHTYERTPAKSTVQVTVDCYPFRILTSDITVSHGLSSTVKTVRISNDAMPVPLTIVTSSHAVIEHKGKRYAVERREHKLGIVLDTGDNTLKISGSGTLTTKYRKEIL